jgi:glycosyltransferase involved in cell wall biosynthesis
MLIGIDANEANIKMRVGINQYAFNLLHALYNLNSQHQFVIYLKNPALPDLPAPRPGWSYRLIPFPKIWTQTRLPWDLYTHTPRPDVFFSMTHYAPRFSPVPTVISIMDLGFLKTPEQFTSKDFNQLKSWTKYSVSQASKIIAISQYTKSDVVSQYHKNPDDICVTPLGYDTQIFFTHKSTTVLDKYQIHKPYFLFLSSLKPSKNVIGLVRAYAAGKFKQSLVIVGKKAWLFDEIFAEVKKMKLQNQVIFTGFMPELEVPELMSHAAAFVLPSFYEGFGIPVLEAMACGTPVVVSKVASLPEVAGNAAIYIDPYDQKSLTNGMMEAVGEKRSHYIKLGLAQAKLFSWAKCAQSTLACLETATESH